MPNVFIRIRKPPAPGERHHPQGQGNEAMNGQHLMLSTDPLMEDMEDAKPDFDQEET